MESDQEELKRLLSEKIDKGNTLLVKLATFPSLNGKSKLERRIIAELKFLQKVRKEFIVFINILHTAFFILVTKTKCIVKKRPHIIK